MAITRKQALDLLGTEVIYTPPLEVLSTFTLSRCRLTFIFGVGSLWGWATVEFPEGMFRDVPLDDLTVPTPMGGVG